MSLPKEFFVKRLRYLDVDQVCNFLTENYTGSNNLLSLLRGVKQEDVIAVQNSRIKSFLKQPFSVGIYTKSSKKLVSLVCGHIRKIEKENKSIEKPDFIQLRNRLVAKLEGDVFSQLKIDRVYDIGIGVTHKDYRNRGLLLFNYKTSLRLSQESGCKYSVVRPSNEYMCQMFERHYPESIVREIKYSNYIDSETGKNPFVNLNFINLTNIF